MVKSDQIADSGEPDFKFEDMLRVKSRDRKLSKRERTHFFLLAVVAKCVQADSTRNPTVDTVLTEAGLARSTFYNHFRDIDESIYKMLVEFFDYLGSIRVSSSRELSSYEAILEANSWYCRAYGVNANLFGAVSRNPEVLKLRDAQNTSWARKILHVSERRRGSDFDPRERAEYEGIIRFLITMTIEAARERFVAKDAVLCQSFPTPERMAEALSSIWYLTMAKYEQDPRN